MRICARGFVRVAVGGTMMHLDDLNAARIDLATADDVLIVIDRLTIDASAQTRIADAVQVAFTEGDGDAVLLFPEPLLPPQALRNAQATGEVTRLMFTERFECPNDGTRAPLPTPQLFSFNNPRGACPTCNGFGATLTYDEALIVPNQTRSIRDGAIDPWTAPRYEKERRTVVEFARSIGVSPDTAWSALPAKAREQFLRTKTRGYTGIFPFLENLEDNQKLSYAGRPAAASPAVGYYAKHNEQQKALIQAAFGRARGLVLSK